MTHRRLAFCIVLVVLCFTACSPTEAAEGKVKKPASPVAAKAADAAATEAKAAARPFKDEPAAHALYKQMIEALRKSKSLFYVSHYTLEVKGEVIGNCTYRAWLKKPNYFRLEAESASEAKSASEGKGGILIGDGNTFWIYWPQGRPRFELLEDSEAYQKTRLNCYMKEPTPPGRHSIGHEARFLGGGMSMLVLDPSTFHGYSDSLQPYIDGVKSFGTEKVGTEECDKIELSVMKQQRSWYFWLSQRDHLPRKLKGITRFSCDIVTNEEWTSVTLNADMPETMFAWQPPKGWMEWKEPGLEERLLRPGTKAPDFKLASSDGKAIKLSDYRGQFVWLCMWRVGCPPCRKEIPYLQEVYKQCKGKGLVILGFNVDDDNKIALKFLREKGVTFPNITDVSEAAQRVAFQDYRGSSAVPLNYLIDRDGNVVDAWYGYDEGKPKAIAALQKMGGELAKSTRRDKKALDRPRQNKP